MKEKKIEEKDCEMVSESHGSSNCQEEFHIDIPEQRGQRVDYGDHVTFRCPIADRQCLIEDGKCVFCGRSYFVTVVEPSSPK